MKIRPVTSINGYPIHCNPNDRKTISYKLNGLPQSMRSEVVSKYSTIYQEAENTYLQAAQKTGSQSNNPVLAKQAKEEARQHANAYLNNVAKMVKSHAEKNDFLDSKDLFRLEFLMLWEKESPDLILLEKEQHHSLDTDSAKELKRQRRARWKAIRAFCKQEGIAFPSSGTPDSSGDNGTRFNRLVGRNWIQKQINKRGKRNEQQRARVALRIGKHADKFLTEDAFQAWKESQKSAFQYMRDTVFISREDDEVEMETVYNGSTAHPKNRKIQLITQVTGMTRYAEKHGFKFMMITPTAASEHHSAPRKSEDGKWILNPNFNPIWTAKATHNHLNEIWERVQADLDRKGVVFFGFKGVESHKDSTPHHHIGFFYQGKTRTVKESFNWYYREMDKLTADLHGQGDYKQRGKIGSEQGLILQKHLEATQPQATKRRVTFKMHDAKKSSLSNYIMKSLLNYVIKDVRDDEDPDQPETEKEASKRNDQERMAAWASLHGIKQFSTLRTGASVGIYQELRRIHEKVEGSTQLEAERVACCGTFGTEDHIDPDKRQNADYCKFMELRRNPAEDRKPVELVIEGEYENDLSTSKVGGFGDQLERVTGVKSVSEGLTITTRPVRWRAVNVPSLLDALVQRETPPSESGSFNPHAENELRELWSGTLETARKQRTLHEFGRAVYNWPISERVGESFSDRAQPVITWKIRNNPTFSESTDWKEDIPINPKNELKRAADSDLKQVQPHIVGQHTPTGFEEVSHA